MRLYDVPAPAKLNLFLHVVGQREDGYHLLQTVFRFIDLCDTLHFERSDDGQIVCEPQIPGLAAEDNLIVRAGRALQKATGTRWGARIACSKRIPAGGGLGGGSSDAATTLIALNRLWETGLTRRQLMQLALPLGADVPVFVFGQPAFAEGIGERLSAVELPERSYLVVKPAQHVSTPEIFTDPGLTRDTKSIKITVFAGWALGKHAKHPAEVRNSEVGNSVGSQLGSSKDWSGGFFGRNDLEPVVVARYPAVEMALAFLARSGVNARMTGSGACFFAEFVTYEQALLNQQEIIGKIPYCGNTVPVIEAAWACHGLLDHPLRYWTKD